MLTKVCLLKAMIFPVVMYGCKLYYKESGAPKNWCFWIVVLEKTLESPLDYKEVKPVHPKGHQSWIFIGITDAETETPILWPPDAKNRLIGKDPDAGKDWRQEKKGMTEDEMVGWHHQLNGHESEQALGVGDGQGGLECCSPWGRKKLDLTEWLKSTDSGSKHARLRSFITLALLRPGCLVTLHWEEDLLFCIMSSCLGISVSYTK